MEKRYSEMTESELRNEIAHLNEKAKKAEQMGMASEFAVYERKMIMAKAYLLNPEDYLSGETYEMVEGQSTFLISYMNGRFAWGYRSGSNEIEGVPISVLKRK